MPSIEALAMAGVDCVECGISLEERERRDTEKTPLYLLADQGEEGLKTHEKDKLMVEQWLVKNKMEAWPKVAARPVTNGVSNIQSREKKRLNRMQTLTALLKRLLHSLPPITTGGLLPLA
ncbi:hypothetical protein D5086_010213 [Populus alba]|uniref:Uncharacterized protein n=2 Tax=Populus alba TaxID=43335 RepID=A0A4U5NA99_POPAL|nr:hypothetical protein D5086_0000274190 [Populus alba]